jgi:hypothetical protein
MKFLTLKTLSSLTFVSLLSACSSTPRGPVTDKFTTEPFVWDSEKSEALNLLRSADLHKYFSDVDSEEDFNNVRYRKSTAKSVFDYVGGFAAFGIAGILNNHANHEDDENSKFNANTYVTYIPVDKKDLTNVEQSILRERAVAQLSASLNTEENKSNWHYRDHSRFIINLSGEACDFIGNSYQGTKLEKSSCATSVYAKVARIIDANESKLLVTNKNKWIAVIKIRVPSPFASLIAAKEVDSSSFVAFIDTYKSKTSYINVASPVVATSDRILPFLNPKKSNIKTLADKSVKAIVCARETILCYSTAISTDEKLLTKNKIKTK